MEHHENRVDELTAEIGRDWSEILSGNLRHLRLSRELEAQRRVVAEERNNLQQKLDAARSLLLVRGSAAAADQFDRLAKDSGAAEERILELVEKLATSESRFDSLTETLDRRREDLQRAEIQVLKLRQELAALRLGSHRLESERSRLEHAVTSMMRIESAEGGPPRGASGVRVPAVRRGFSGFARGLLMGLALGIVGYLAVAALLPYVG